MTIIVPGVLNGSKGALYYPPEEVAANPSSWDWIPIVDGHPYVPGQGHVWASYPSLNQDILNRLGMGFCLKSNAKDGRLRTEGWFDEEHTQRVNPEVYAALNEGRSIELSTGLGTEDDRAEQGAKCPVTGRPYDYVARNYRPDHLAILTKQVGACSLNDGCGVLVNSSRGDSVNKKSIWMKLGEALGITDPTTLNAVTTTNAAKKGKDGKFTGGDEGEKYNPDGSLSEGEDENEAPEGSLASIIQQGRNGRISANTSSNTLRELETVLNTPFNDRYAHNAEIKPAGKKTQGGTDTTKIDKQAPIHIDGDSDGPLEDEDEHQEPSQKEWAGMTTANAQNPLSKSAQGATLSAMHSDSPEAHKKAADAHTAAAAAQDEAGNTSKAAGHSAMAEMHGKLCGLTGNGLFGKPDPPEPPAIDPAQIHEASKQASMATVGTAHEPVADHAVSAIQASKVGDSKTAADSHLKAAGMHESAAKGAMKQGDMEGADTHGNAAALHRKAAMMHTAVPMGGGRMTPEPPAGGAAGAPKGTSSPGAAPSGGASSGGSPKSPMGGGKPPGMNQLESEVNSNGGTKVAFNRQAAIAKLTANCKCSDEKKAYNSLTNITLAKLVGNVGQGQAVGGGDGGSIQAGGEEDTSSEVDPDVDPDKVKPKSKMGGASGESTQNEAQRYADELYQEARTKVLRRLTANIKNDELRKKTIKLYNKMNLNELRVLAQGVPMPEAPRRNRMADDDDPSLNFLGAGGGIEGGITDNDDGFDKTAILSLPTMNDLWAEDKQAANVEAEVG